MNYKVVVPAAGQGKRMNMGVNKQFIKVNNLPILALTLLQFQNHEPCKGIILAIQPDDLERTKNIISEYGLTKVEQIVYGGEERQDSIFKALRVVKNTENVFVHDGARPFISQDCLNRLCEALNDYEAVVPMIPVKDTIKRIDGNFIIETPPREQLVAAQTPQAFKLKILMQAYECANNSGFRGTDDASLVEHMGVPVKVIKGERENIKITTPEDLILAEQYGRS